MQSMQGSFFVVFSSYISHSIFILFSAERAEELEQIRLSEHKDYQIMELDQKIEEMKTQMREMEARYERRFERDINMVQNSLTLRACLSEFDVRLARYMLQTDQQYWENLKYIEGHPITVRWEIPTSAMSLITTSIENPTRSCVSYVVFLQAGFLCVFDKTRVGLFNQITYKVFPK